MYETFEIAIVNDDNNAKTEWREVLCGNQVKGNIVNQIRRSLINNGFDISESNRNIIDQEVKNALVAYQKKNGLLIGSLDLETLKILKVTY